MATPIRKTGRSSTSWHDYGDPGISTIVRARVRRHIAVSEGNLGRALAAFQRTLVASNSPFDRYMRGDSTAMTADQIRGMERFQSDGCIECHNGPMFSDLKKHVLAVPDNAKLKEPDPTEQHLRISHGVTAQPASAPYMHNGVLGRSTKS